MVWSRLGAGRRPREPPRPWAARTARVKARSPEGGRLRADWGKVWDGAGRGLPIGGKLCRGGARGGLGARSGRVDKAPQGRTPRGAAPWAPRPAAPGPRPPAPTPPLRRPRTPARPGPTRAPAPGSAARSRGRARGRGAAGCGARGSDDRAARPAGPTLSPAVLKSRRGEPLRTRPRPRADWRGWGPGPGPGRGPGGSGSQTATPGSEVAGRTHAPSPHAQPPVLLAPRPRPAPHLGAPSANLSANGAGDYLRGRCCCVSRGQGRLQAPGIQTVCEPGAAGAACN